MAAKPHGDHTAVFIGCPPTTAYCGSHGREASVAQAEPSRREARNVGVAFFILATLLFAIIVAGVVIVIEFPEEQPKYSVAVTGIAGLDPARDLSARDRPTLSPVFNVTVHIDNRRNTGHGACIPNFATAAVSYGDAFLGKGTVPLFCAGKRKEEEGVARAWAQDVVVPWFLRDELAAKLAAGEAAVDISLMPLEMVCKAKIGGGLSRCRAPQSFTVPARSAGSDD